MSRRRFLWIAIPAATAVGIFSLSMYARREQVDPAFGFLTALHPLRGPFKPIASTYLITGGHVPTDLPPIERILVFPASEAVTIESTVSTRFAPEVGGMTESSYVIVNGAVVTHTAKQAIHTDGQGREILVISGAYVDRYRPLFGAVDVPADCCLVATISPVTGVQAFVAKLMHFLHLR